jgi:hypothetical protein
MLEPLQFHRSPYDGNVRWALDITRVSQKRRAYQQRRGAHSDFAGPIPPAS